MNYSQITDSLSKMLSNSAPTSEVISENHPNAIHFWGEDSEATIQTEGFPDLNFAPDPGAGPSFSVFGEGVPEFESFISKIKEDSVISERVGNKAIENSLEILLRKFYNTDPQREVLEKAIRDTAENLKKAVKKWTAIMPVDFLIFEDLTELQVGSVVLKPATDTVSRLLTEFHNCVNANNSSEQEKENTLSVLAIMVKQEFNQTSSYAEVEVEAENSRVREMAEEEAETALNLLRCFTNVLFDQRLDTKMGLRHETGYRMRPIFGFSSDKSFLSEIRNVGLNHEFKVSKNRVEFMKRDLAFGELSAIIKKTDSTRSKLEKLIVTAIRWLGRGVVESDPANKILHYAAASENLIMGGQNEGEISEKFSQRVAMLIGKSGEERMNLATLTKTLYAKRSKVIHSGSTNVSPIDLQNMETITLRSIIEMTKHLSEFKKHEDFVTWCKRETYGVP